MAPMELKLSAEALGTEVVTIYVGPDKKPFVFHKRILCDRSDYFSKALNSGFIEAKENSIYMPEDDAEAFDFGMATYIYQNKLPSLSLDQGLSSDEMLAQLKKLYRLFYLAEKLCMNELCNMVIDSFSGCTARRICAHIYTGFAESETLIEIYQNTHTSSKLRRYMVLNILSSINSMEAGLRWRENGPMLKIEFQKSIDSFKNKAANIALVESAFGYDFIRLMGDPAIALFPDELDACYFHTHGSGEICHLSKGEDTDAIL
ncbi:hypothetical protein B0O99DRAFT_679957 [Bisporella sp. PMI_857]|nr:hypothetical protein B0O99DRAFT_679957 [Bisporella sp. PMI_857]